MVACRKKVLVSVCWLCVQVRYDRVVADRRLNIQEGYRSTVHICKNNVRVAVVSLLEKLLKRFHTMGQTGTM